MNQPPQAGKQAGKRIVSKGEYAKVQGRRWLQGTTAVALMIFFFVSSTAMIAISHGARLLLALYFTVLGIVSFARLAVPMLRQAIKADPGIPLTRANTADLPATDSLVRASQELTRETLIRAASEPVQETLVRAASPPSTLPSVLLRSVGQGQETPLSNW